MEAGSHNKAKLTIGRLAKAAGVALTTVRYYQRRGLIAEPKKPRFGGYRVYSDTDLARLLRIRRAQELGFTLAEITDILANADKHQCKDNKVLAAEKLKEITGRIRQLEIIRKSLATVADHCPDKCSGRCPLVGILEDGSGAETSCRHSKGVKGIGR